MKKQERWLACPNYVDYEVSDWGRVRRSCNNLNNRYKAKMVLKIHKNNTGYAAIGLFKNGKQKLVNVHQLVGSVFLGKCPKGKITNHKDGNKMNASLSNLEYVTERENLLHAYKIGL